MAWLIQITSGRGPDECCLLVAKIADAILGEAAQTEDTLYVLNEVEASQPKIYHSKTLLCTTEDLPSWLSLWKGTIKWICTSPYRPTHKRKNWFAGVEITSSSMEDQDSDIKPQDIKFEAFQSSGPGGQNVNKVSSAVRLTHMPSGLIVTARESRSQLENKKLALKRLKCILESRAEEQASQAEKRQWYAHNELERGKEVLVFKGPDFRRSSK